MFDSLPDQSTGTGRRPIPEQGWASDPEPTPRGKSSKLKGTTPKPAPLQKRALPNRLADNVSLPELRNLCGDTDYPENKRLALMLISMWLPRQTKNLNQARRTAAELGTEVCRDTKSAEQLALLCFPGEAVEMVIKKAKAMLMICAAGLVPDVKDLATSHVSSKCSFTAEHVEIASVYARRLVSKRPNAATFNAPSTLETWWPDFP